MINDRIQRQEAGDNSTNYQAENININQGITYRDAKDIALDIYRQNFMQLSEQAAKVALERVEEFVDEFLDKLQSKSPSLLDVMNQPSIQHSLYSAQKQYAVTGDEELKGLLLDLVVQRCEKENRSIHQIVLDEAIAVASKLTVEQMDALTINFIISRTVDNNIVNLDAFFEHLDTSVIPFLESLRFDSSCYDHLPYVGVATIEYTGLIPQLYEQYREKYAAAFSKGLSKEIVDDVVSSDPSLSKHFMICHEYPNLLQVCALNENSLRFVCQKDGVSNEGIDKLISLLRQSTMSNEEAKVFLLDRRPALKKLFSIWEKTLINKIFLTPVGVAIAQANLQRRTGKMLMLDMWVK